MAEILSRFELYFYGIGMLCGLGLIGLALLMDVERHIWRG